MEKLCIKCKRRYIPRSSIQKVCLNCTRDFRLEQRRIWIRKNFAVLKEKKKVYDKIYHQKNKSKRNKHSLEYYRTHQKDIKYYRQKKKKELSIYNMQYYQKNMNRIKKLRQSKKAKLKQKEYKREYRKKDKFKVKLKARSYSNSNNQRGDFCEECGSINYLNFHHTDYKNNRGITLCQKCHRKKHIKLNV